MRVLVFEAQTGGHYLHWAGVLGAALSELGVLVTVALSRDAPGTASFRHHIEPFSHLFELDTASPPSLPGTWNGARSRIEAIRGALKRSGANRLYLPTADGVAQSLGAATLLGMRPLGGVAAEALMMNGAVAHLKGLTTLRARQHLSYKLARSGPWSNFFHLNPLVHEWEASIGVKENERVLTMPEPIERAPGFGTAKARKTFNLEPSSTYLGMVGRIDKRKGADLLVEALSHPRMPSDVQLVLFGSFSPEVAQLVRESPVRDRIVMRDEIISDEELLLTLEALDLVVLPYRGVVSSSGLMARAVACGRPVLTTGGGWGEHMNQLFKFGWTIPQATPPAIAENIARVLDSAKKWTASEESRRFIEYNSVANFAAHWCRGLREELKMEPCRDLKSWSWAIEGF